MKIKLITDFKEKTELVNTFYVKQCLLLSKDSVLSEHLPQPIK